VTITGVNTFTYPGSGIGTPTTFPTINSTKSGVTNATATIVDTKITAITFTGGTGYAATPTITISAPEGVSFPNNPSSVTFIDGYFIVSVANGMNVYVSELYNGTLWNPLAFSPVEAAQDNVQAVFNISQQLFILKYYSSELWSDVAIPTSQGCPFQRIPGGVLEFGSSSAASISFAGNSIFCVGSQNVGGVAQFVGIFEVTGYTPAIISPPSIVYQIQQFPTVEDAFSFVQYDSGHVFVWFTFPSGNATFVYDLSTEMWHERSTANTSSYQFNRHFAETYSYFDGKHYVSDATTGNVYEMSNQYFSDFGNQIISVRRAPALVDGQNMNMVSIPRLRFDCTTGVGTLQPNVPAAMHAVINGSGGVDSVVVDNPGADYVSLPFLSLSGDAGSGAVLTPVVVNGQIQSVTVVSPGSGYTAPEIDISGPVVTPNAALSWSDDGGNTWTDDYLRSMGNAGEYDTILEFRGLGKLRQGRMFQLAVSDPCKKEFFGAMTHG
jgi:hypothetical protein